jgi:hypothetical protein
MSVGSTIDAEPNAVCKALALKRALIETVADAGATAFDPVSMALLTQAIDLNHMNKFGGGVTGHNTTRTAAGSARVQNFQVAKVEEHLADIDRQLKALGGS